jgi:serine/threonine protein phosphatase PrpC
LTKLNEKKEMSQQAGASLLVGVSVESSFHCVSVGHCLGLRVRNNDLSPFFLPDSNYQFSMLNYTNDTQVFPYSFLGEGDEFNYTAKSIDLERGDKLFLMTDGVFQRISGMDLLTLCQDFDGQASELSGKLMALANDRGNKDNQSIIVLEY